MQELFKERWIRDVAANQTKQETEWQTEMWRLFLEATECSKTDARKQCWTHSEASVNVASTQLCHGRFLSLICLRNLFFFWIQSIGFLGIIFMLSQLFQGSCRRAGHQYVWHRLYAPLGETLSQFRAIVVSATVNVQGRPAMHCVSYYGGFILIPPWW